MTYVLLRNIWKPLEREQKLAQQTAEQTWKEES